MMRNNKYRGGGNAWLPELYQARSNKKAVTHFQTSFLDTAVILTVEYSYQTQ